MNKREKRVGTRSSDRAAVSSAPRRARRSPTFVLGWAIAGAMILVGGGLLAWRLYIDSVVATMERQCRVASTTGNWPMLQQSASRWAALAPERFEPWVYAAQASEQMGDLPAAVAYYSKMPDAAPLDAWLDLSSLQLESLDLASDALRTCQHTAELYPASAENHRRLLFFYVMLRQRDALIAEANRAIDAGADVPETYVYLVGADWLTFVNGYEFNQRWLKKEPNNEMFETAAVIHLIGSAQANVDYRLPSDAAGKDRLDYLAERLRAALKKYPKNVELLNMQMDRYCKDGQLSELAELLPTAPAETFNDNRFWRFKGWYHMALEEWDAAESAYKKAMELSPIDWKSLTELLSVYRRTQRLGLVEQYQERATEGEEIKREVELVSRADQTQSDLLKRIAHYLHLCGEDRIAKALEKQMQLAGDKPVQ